MSFHNLTPTWTDQPLSDPAVAADVVDLMVTLGDRHRGTFTVLLCDPDDHYRATLTLDLPTEFDHLTPTPPHPSTTSPLGTSTRPSTAPPRAAFPRTSTGRRPAAAPLTPSAPRSLLWDPTSETAEVCSAALSPIIPAIHTAPGTGLLLALGRPGPDICPDLDSEWSRAATTITQAAGIRLLAFYVATPNHIYQPPTPTPAAA